jgi:uroporphyrinogen-III synthase
MDSSKSEVADPLAGFTIAVTAARRAEELITLLERRGAKIVHAPAIRIVPLVDDIELRQVTTRLTAGPPDLVVVTTGIGFRGWIEAAHGWDVADDLIGALGSTRIVARGPKARGAVRQAGLCEEWSPESESSAEVLERLVSEGVEGLRIAVQLHGAANEWETDVDICEVLTKAGAQVIKVPVYRWEQPDDLRRVDALIGMIVTADVDAVSFTSAPAVASILDRAKALGALDDLVQALQTAVRAICVGPVTSGPLRRLGIPASYPQRYRLGALARLIADELPSTARIVIAGGHQISVRSASVEVNGEIRTLAPTAMAMLRCLMIQPGLVVTRDDLLAELPGGSADTHAVETAIARLRSSLQAPGAIQTVVKRGYRLNADYEAPYAI